MRRLNPEEAALWRRVVESVRPLEGKALPPVSAEPAGKSKPRIEKPRPKPSAPPPRKAQPGTTLDGSWDRRLSRGLVAPDAIIDLHGHNLDTAWALLDRRLEQSIALGDRLFLLITGKPPSDRVAKRGAIRAAVYDWLHVSRHAGAIAAVRAAHPRHGGAGALYIILRRGRARP
ncbi:MAG: Smr/MutS family protein [Sphingosinicella sp.]|uniref:Smr/MutS family protein n=1 Tax=Sphingosinicella sp. TaxID=1917971 RepID=UPI0040382062